MKKILILGAGNAQADAINYLKEKGYQVFSCSYYEKDYASDLCDGFQQVDIKNVAAVKQYAEKIEADIIYSVGSDLAIPTAMAVSEELGKPHFVDAVTAAECQNKFWVRKHLGTDCAGNVKSFCVSDVTEIPEELQFPMMLKPVDSQGQRGCFKIDNMEELRKNFQKAKSYSKTENVIIEEFIDGPEISVNAYILDGKVVYSIISDRDVYNEFPGGIIKRHLIPSVFEGNESVVEKVNQLVRDCIEKVHIMNGPLYFQIKVADREPKLIEMAPRLDGCHMWNLIKHYCGVDLLDMTFTHLLNGTPDIKREVREEKGLVLEFYGEKPGEAFDRDKYNTQGLYSNWYYESGAIVKEVNGYMEKCGYRIYEE